MSFSEIAKMSRHEFFLNYIKTNLEALIIPVKALNERIKFIQISKAKLIASVSQCLAVFVF